MTVRVIKQFKGVPDGHVHGKLYQPGDILTGDLAREAVIGGFAVEDAAVQTKQDAAAPPSGESTDGAPVIDVTPPPVRARLTKKVEFVEADGRETVLAKGAVVEGEVAEDMLARGVAVRLAAHGAAPQTR